MKTDPDESLTFSEAMALDPSEVEMRWSSTTPWGALDGDTTGSLSDFRHAQFRRARPKRSRVQEMAEAHRDSIKDGSYTEVAMTAAIRAVCEYLAERVYATRTTPRQPMDGGEVAGDVKRHFLEPR